MNEEYKLLYENGPNSVGLVLARTQTGSNRGDSRNLQLEGILSGETDTTLIFDELKLVNEDTSYMKMVKASKALVKKEYIAMIYQIEK